MTKEPARGNGPAMSREQMQTEALIVEKLVDAAMALHTGENPHEALPILDMAFERAHRLHEALDSIHAKERVA